MAKQNILIVDADPESVKVLEVSLKKAGYSVTTAKDGAGALEVLTFSTPELVISETQMYGLDGFALCTKLKENEEWSKIPFIFLTADKSVENKIRGLELGVDDYLNKPIFIREILVRVNLAIQRRQKERLERRGTKSKFSGNLQDMGVVDLMQTIDLGHKSGVLHIIRLNDDGSIYFKDGQVIDAMTRTRTGADAVYRMLVWSDGTFEIEFTNVDRPERIRMSTQGLLMEGMRRLDEWGRLQEQLPALTAVFDVDEKMLAERLGEIPDEVNTVLRHFDGHATLLEVVDNGTLGDLEALTLISKLYFEGLITEIQPTMSSLDSGLDPNALLPDSAESWEPHSRPPVNVPSRLMDDALGPHLSVAAQFAGLTGSPTESPPADPPLPELPNTSETVLGMAAMKLEVPTAAPQAEEPKLETPAPVAKPTVPATPAKREKSIDAEPEPAPEKASPRETRTLTSREISDAEKIAALIEAESIAAAVDSEKIAAAIDAELPPPDASDEDSSRGDDAAYFDGKAYRASMVQGGPSYDAEPYRSSETSTQTGTNAGFSLGVDKEPPDPDEPPPHELFLDWPEDPPEVPRSKIPIIAAAAVLLIGGGIAAYLMLGDAKIEQPMQKPAEEQVAAATLVPVRTTVDTGKETVEPKQDSAAAVEPSAAAADTSALGDTDPVQKSDTEESVKSASDGIASADTPTPSDTAAIDAPPAVDTSVSSARKQLTPEETQTLNDLLKKAEKTGRKKKIELYREALEIDPTSDEALAGLSIQLLENKQTRQEALSLAERAVAVNPDNAVGWLAKGYILQLTDRGDEARAAYRKCAEGTGPADYKLECKRLAR